MPATLVPRRSPRSGRQIRWSRHAVQTVVVAWIAWIVWSKAVAGPGSASAEALCPFGGFETALDLDHHRWTVAHVHPANLVLAWRSP